MQSALKFSTLLLCLSLSLGDAPFSAPAVAERTLAKGCPSTRLDCPAPKPASDETPAPPTKGKKGAKG